MGVNGIYPWPVSTAAGWLRIVAMGTIHPDEYLDLEGGQRYTPSPLFRPRMNAIHPYGVLSILK